MVDGEDVIRFDGCIGTTGTKEAPSQPNPETASKFVLDQCESVSSGTHRSKSIDLIPSRDCGNSAISAGFAFRTTSREVTMTGVWKIGDSVKRYPLKFDISTIEMAGNAGGSAGKIGAALLPIPQPAKGAMAALLDKVGTASFSAQYDKAQTIIRDAVKPYNSNPASVSKLARNIATDILQKACRQYSSEYNLKHSCDVRKTPVTYGCSADLEKLERMAIVNCKSAATMLKAEKNLYALVL